MKLVVNIWKNHGEKKERLYEGYFTICIQKNIMQRSNIFGGNVSPKIFLIFLTAFRK